jgi:hypothetical protein
MPYTTDELINLEFYQEIARRDEIKYLELIENKTQFGNTIDGILRDTNSGNIILFEKIIPGEGTDGTGHLENHTLSWNIGYFDYEENEELNKIIDREFTEF